MNTTYIYIYKYIYIVYNIYIVEYNIYIVEYIVNIYIVYNTYILLNTIYILLNIYICSSRLGTRELIVAPSRKNHKIRTVGRGGDWKLKNVKGWWGNAIR